MENKNQPITATLTYNEHDGKPDGHLLGLTKREYFAAMAMQGMASHDGKKEIDTCLEIPSNVAKWSVMYADALLTALDKTK